MDKETKLMLVSIGLIVVGMVGLSLSVPYSGWVLAAGLFGFVFTFM